MPEPKWLTVGRGELGTAEIEGPKSNSKIVRYAKEAAGIEAPDSDAWCATFVGAMLARDGLDETKGTGKRNARSYLDWGKALEEPTLGCIVVFWRGSPKSWQGHVGFFIKQDPTYVWVLGGNQGNKVSIARYPKKQLLGYRWPTAAADPNPPAQMDPQLKQVQIRLKELGYHDVGTPDGRWGGKTRGMLLAFIADWNDERPGTKDDLSVPTKTDKASFLTQPLLAALMEAPPRTVSPERETAEPEKIGDHAAVKDAKRTGTIGAVITTIGAGGIAEVTGGLAKAEEYVGIGTRVRLLIGEAWAVIEPLWPFAVVAGGVALIYFGRKIWKEEIHSYRKGETQ